MLLVFQLVLGLSVDLLQHLELFLEKFEFGLEGFDVGELG